MWAERERSGKRNEAGRKVRWGVEKNERSETERGAGGRGAGTEQWAEITEISINAERQKRPRSAPLKCAGRKMWPASDNITGFISMCYAYSDNSAR